MKLLFAILAAVLLAGCTIHYPAELDKLGPPTRDPGTITEITYKGLAEVHDFCVESGANGGRSLANPNRFFIRGCAFYGKGWCQIHYKDGDDLARRHELAHCTHGAWHD